MFANGQELRTNCFETDHHSRQGDSRPMRRGRRQRNRDAAGTARLRARAVPFRLLIVVMVIAAGAMLRDAMLIVHRALVRLRSGQSQTEHYREQHARESHGVNIPPRHQTVLSFQRPRRNNIALATASVEKAIVTAQATPRGP